MMRQHNILRAGMLFLINYGLITVLFIYFSQYYASFLLGSIKAAMVFWSPELYVEQLIVAKEKSQLMFVSLLSNKHNLIFTSQTIPANTQVQSSTLVGNAIQLPIIIFCLLSAWPNLAIQRRFLAGVIAVPVIFIVTLIDIPLVLIGSAWDAFYFYMEPKSAGRVFSIYAMNILNNGGRLALAIAAVVCCIYIQSFIVNATTKTAQLRERFLL